MNKPISPKRLVTVLTTVAFLSTYVAPAWAEAPATVVLPTDEITAAPPPVIAPLWQGQPAPFAGVILSPEATATVIAQKDAASKQLQLAVEERQALDAAQGTYQLKQQASTCTADKTVLQAQLTDAQKQYALIDAQLKKVDSAPSAPVWIGVGVVGGVVLTLLTVFAASKATK